MAADGWINKKIISDKNSAIISAFLALFFFVRFFFVAGLGHGWGDLALSILWGAVMLVHGRKCRREKGEDNRR